jgi:hypothetical protein
MAVPGVEVASVTCAVAEGRSAAEGRGGRHAACGRDDRRRRRHSATRTTADGGADVEGATDGELGAADEFGSHFADEDGWVVRGEVGDAVEEAVVADESALLV